MPETNELQKKMSTLSPEKRALLALRLKQRGEQFNTFPLSFAQERLWVIDQLAPGSPAYNIPIAMRMAGRPDVTALERALTEVARRHEVLRTTYRTVGGEPVQAVSPAAPVVVSVTDLSRLPEAEREERAMLLTEEEARTPFDLSAGPMFRAGLLRLGECDHVLLFSMHHIVSDMWSTHVLVREVAALYEAFVKGEPSPLPALPIQYADFAVWQRGWLKGEVLEKQLDYWRRRLAGAPPLLELPTDRPRPASQTMRGDTYVTEFPAELSRRLRELSNREGVTLFVTMLAAFQLLLSRYTGQRDIVVGSPIANRNRAETEGLIGFFVNTLVLRTDLSGDPTFRELIARVRDVAYGAYAHQDLPFEKLVQELNPERNQSYAPLFQVSFGMQSQLPKGQQYEMHGLTLSTIDTQSGTSKFDLVQKIVETNEGLLSFLHYSTDLFDAETIRRLSTHFLRLLEAAATDPDLPVCSLPLLDAAERSRLLSASNLGAPSLAAPCLHHLFASRAALSPDAPAVVFEDTKLTYSELDERANRLAHHLQSLGVGPEVMVGLLLERSAEMVVSILAVAKAGGAYVPLDPSSPADRLRFMLEDSAVRVLVTQESLADSLGESLRDVPQVVRVDSDAALIASYPSSAPSSSVGPENLAYVIYTSGSTGRPKGSLVTHRNVSRLLSASAPHFDFTPSDVWTLFHSYAFDFSVWEMWAPLCTGGSVVVVPYWVSRSPEEFLRLLRERRVTVLNQTPSAFRQLSAAALSGVGEEGEGLSLRAVVFGGEALDPSALAPWFSRFGDQEPRLVNMYGITETTVHVTLRPLTEADSRGHWSPVGGPLPDLELYVLDGRMEPVPEGVAGELYVGGDGLARGYLSRPSLTAERFVPHPFGEGGGRLYRTGDVARRLAGGEVVYVGRCDEQVKVRGFRIELGEIEAALQTHAGVRECVVVAREGEGGEKRLAAYVVAADGAGELSVGELRAHLKGVLPDYMVPSAYVWLAEMPLTQNGKLDRKALPEPDPQRATQRESEAAPLTPLQQWVASRWASVLGLPGVGADDNFFDLGGDSIRAAVLTNRLQEELGEVVHVVTVFDSPTVSAYASYLEGRYPRAVARLLGAEGGGGEGDGSRAAVGAAEVLQLAELAAAERARLTELAGEVGRPARRNAPAVFILSAPRSGSTLLRVMLGGHPELFAPPELELLGYDTIRQRSEALSGRDRFWREGVERAVMELRGCGVEEAREVISSYDDSTTAEFYGALQGWCGGRTLVDKTPSYALERGVLERAEEWFEGARYIHLIRRPEAMINSFVEAEMDQIFPRFRRPLGGRELGEAVWALSQQNITEFLKEVDAGRRQVVVFEELVREPGRVLRGVCEWLGLEYHPRMEEPYANKAGRMTDGVREGSRMLGDIKFHGHGKVEAGAGERWRERGVGELGEETVRLARLLGYEVTEGAKGRSQSAGAAEGKSLGQEGRALTPILPRLESGASGEFPLSFAQERLWFLYQLEPESPFYNMSVPVRLSGELNLPALSQTLTEIVRRHAVLRTKFPTVDGHPVQVVSPPAEVAQDVLDLSGLPEAERDAELQRLVAEDSQRPFDLEREHALRVGLVRLSASEHVALFTMHHIISDGWSMGVLVREIAALYAAFSNGEESPLSELPIQYADFAVWQREWLRGAELEGQLAYWRRQLAGARPTLQLPLARPRPASQKFRGASHSFTLPAELSGKLKALSRGQRATLYMTLLAGLQALLYRYTGQTDISVGTDMAGRNRAEVEGLIGFFVNLLVMRVDLSGGPGFAELVGRVREVCLGAYAHQDLPFEKLVEELKPERSLGPTPLFQVLFVYRNTPQGTLELPGLKLSAVGADNETSKFDLALFIGEEGDEITGTWKYNSDLFDGAALEKMSGHYRTLLASAAAQPDARIEGLEMLTEAEKQTQLDAQKTRAESNLKRFKSTKPKAVSLSRKSLVRTGFLPEGPEAPLVIEPDVENFDLADWAANNRQFIEQKLYEHGSVLFRGCGVKGADDLEGFARTQCSELFGEYGDLPREGQGGKVYGSTPYPSDRAILFHNESSHMHRWPMKIWFLCVQAPETGGETPIVDCRKVYRLLDPRVRERFAEKGLMYVRNYVEGLDVSWQSFFRTNDRAEVEAYCRAASVEFEWKGETGLRTSQVCGAVSRHPRTAEETFFNQIQLHHVSCLEPAVRQSLRSVFGEEDLPRNVFYGDGSPIEDSIVGAVREVYDRATVKFAWRPGDVLMLDNMLTAHGRNPYTGARKVVVALGEMVHKEEVERASRGPAVLVGA